ncbi:hypothetical protein SLAVM298S_01457 [Streptomyces lavendulae subsp. lavendulae]
MPCAACASATDWPACARSRSGSAAVRAVTTRSRAACRCSARRRDFPYLISSHPVLSRLCRKIGSRASAAMHPVHASTPAPDRRAGWRRPPATARSPNRGQEITVTPGDVATEVRQGRGVTYVSFAGWALCPAVRARGSWASGVHRPVPTATMSAFLSCCCPNSGQQHQGACGACPNGGAMAWGRIRGRTAEPARTARPRYESSTPEPRSGTPSPAAPPPPPASRRPRGLPQGRSRGRAGRRRSGRSRRHFVKTRLPRGRAAASSCPGGPAPRTARRRGQGRGRRCGE